MIRTPRIFTFPILISILFFCSLSQAEEINVAVAANFTDASREIAKRFEEATGHTAKISYGSTGKLYAQIANGAPFDVFLAADAERPEKAEKEGLAVADSLFVYARGKLVFWSADENAFGNNNPWKNNHFKRVAIANPKTAPYGLAARQVLEHLDLWTTLHKKLVRGDSIAQTFQFVATGNAEAGFVAASQVRGWKGKPGTSWEIPADHYSPISQAAVLLKKGEHNPAAKAYLEFLKSDTSRNIISGLGYGVE